MPDEKTHIDAENAIARLDELKLGEFGEDIELEARSENHIIATHMANQARRTLKIFTRDLDPFLYDQADFVAACKNLALAGRFSNIEILAIDSQRIARRGHRLLNLSRTLSSYIQIRRPEKQYESRLETFMTVDERGYMYRKNAERYEGIANFNDPRQARELNKQFAEMWERSTVDTEMRSLNI